MAQHFPLMIPGANASGETLEVTAAFDEQIIATADVADEQIIETALTTAEHLFRHKSSWLPLAERIAILSRTADIIRERRVMLATEAAREGGKPLRDSLVEVDRAIESIQLCAESMRSDAGEVIPMGINTASQNRLAFTQKEPIGVVVAVSAFNHPVNLIAHQVGPAIATGCPIIIKPASTTPLSCLRMVEILREAGLPAQWCQPVVIKETTLATQLVTDERVAFFSFIGSAQVGWNLRSQLAPGTRCACEHGGVAPVIVTENADLDETLPLLTKGGFYHAGQVCVSVQRIFANKKIATQLAKDIAAAAKKLKIGDPTTEETDVGPLISPREVERVATWVDEAIQAGATLLTGGHKISDTCYECTVLLNPPLDAKVSCQEVFGPVVCVYTYDHVDEAIEWANSLEVAFQASVFSADLNTILHCYKQLDASAVMVNDHTAFRVDWMPFAGLRHSGLGVGGVPHTISDMQIDKMMMIKSVEL